MESAFESIGGRSAEPDDVGILTYCSVIRSKQAGPFRLTFDLIFRNQAAYDYVKTLDPITPDTVASLYGLESEQVLSVTYFDPGLALKISIVRPHVAGALEDGDAYGCQQHVPLLDLRMPPPPWEIEPYDAPEDAR